MPPQDVPDLSEAKSEVVMYIVINQKTPTNTASITQKPNITRYEPLRPDERHDPRPTFTPHP